MSFPGTEHYRQRAARRGSREKSYYMTELRTAYKEDITALCDHIDELQKKIQELNLDEVSRLTQEIIEPSYNQLHKENAALKDSAKKWEEMWWKHEEELGVYSHEAEVRTAENAELREALSMLQVGIKKHIEKIEAVAPTHPTIHHWKDFVDDVLQKQEKGEEQVETSPKRHTWGWE